jgi:hypothetical protein
MTAQLIRDLARSLDLNPEAAEREADRVDPVHVSIEVELEDPEPEEFYPTEEPLTGADWGSRPEDYP